MLEQALELADFQRDSDGKLRAGPGKFEGLRPFDVWIASNVLGDPSWVEDEFGDSVTGSAWYGRAGRYIIEEDSSGFVYVHHSPSVEQAELSFREQAEAESEGDAEDETSFSEEWHAAYRHARYVRDADVNTAESFADFVDERAELIDLGAAEFGESPYSDAWSAFVRERTPRSGDGHRD